MKKTRKPSFIFFCFSFFLLGMPGVYLVKRFIFGQNLLGNLSSKLKPPLSLESSFTTTPLLVQKKQDPLVHTFHSSDSDLKLKLNLLEEIILSRNDNDPRLDTEFRQISPALKQALRQRYDQTPREERNTRGLMVYLLGRNLTQDSDLDFIQKVLQEEPCLSLEDCPKPKKSHQGTTDPHSVEQITLLYPQKVALYYLKTYLKVNPHSEVALQILQKASYIKGIPQ